MKEVTAYEYKVLFDRYKPELELMEQIFFIQGHPQCPQGYQRILWQRATDKKLMLKLEFECGQSRFWANWWIHQKQRY